MSNFLLRIYKSPQYQKYKIAWFLLVVCFIFVVLRIPSLIEPNWYADEGIYQVVGRAINADRILYKEIWDNKPPFLYLLYASVNGNLFFIKLLSLIFGVASVLVFFLLASKVFHKAKTSYISTGIYAFFFATPLLEGNIGNAENFMLLPVLLAGYLVYSYALKGGQKFLLICAGVLLSFAFMTKIVAVFDLCAFLLFFLFLQKTKNYIEYAKSAVLLISTFLSLFVICSLYFLANGAYGDFFSAVFTQNVSYVGDKNEFILPMGSLIIKSILLSVVVIIIQMRSKKLDPAAIFIYLWVSFALFSAFFSDRPYVHYLLLLLAPLSLLVGLFIENKKMRIVSGIGIFVILLLVLARFQLYPKTTGYYVNFIEFITNRRSIIAYESFFDNKTPRDYALANFIKTNTTKDETVFLWSDSAQIYALADKLPVGKYTVRYHITFYKNADKVTLFEIEKKQPKYIIQTLDVKPIDGMLSSYELRYEMDGVKIYERTI